MKTWENWSICFTFKESMLPHAGAVSGKYVFKIEFKYVLYNVISMYIIRVHQKKEDA